MKTRKIERKGVGTFYLREDHVLAANAIRLRRARLIDQTTFHVSQECRA